MFLVLAINAGSGWQHCRKARKIISLSGYVVGGVRNFITEGALSSPTLGGGGDLVVFIALIKNASKSKQRLKR